MGATGSFSDKDLSLISGKLGGIIIKTCICYSDDGPVSFELKVILFESLNYPSLG